MGIFSWLSGNSDDAEQAPSSVPTPSPEDSLTDLEALARNSDTLAVPTMERLGLLFDAQGWKWDFDDDGDIASGWDGSMLFFRMIGKNKEIFSVLGIRRGLIDREHRRDLMLAIEDWHRGHLWPKGYFYEAPGDKLEVRAELTVDLEKGMTDEQLLLQCRCAIGTILPFFEDIDQRFGVPAEEDSES